MTPTKPHAEMPKPLDPFASGRDCLAAAVKYNLNVTHKKDEKQH